MELESIAEVVDQFGYVGLFLWLWLGVFGAPIPNEVIVLTVGFISSSEVLVIGYAFFVVYLGIVCALTTTYLLGRCVGSPLLLQLKKYKRFSHSIDRSLNFMNKYHTFSLPLSYFLPGLRNLVPFLYGVSKLKYKTFAILAYSAAFVWTVALFQIGYWFGEEIDTLRIYFREAVLVGLAGLGVTAYFIWRKRKRVREH
ncbi:DedA family protein [Bacillus carboniphilus]|uniref:DedA family protein n=1 Tax=Bacillus carboniphilus TaxID=86663 RepID=A0ABP3FXK5_9BACI